MRKPLPPRPIRINNVFIDDLVLPDYNKKDMRDMKIRELGLIDEDIERRIERRLAIDAYGPDGFASFNLTQAGARELCDAIEESLDGEVRHANFGFALSWLQKGHRVAREGWNGKGQHLELQVPDENSKMTLPYIFITTVQGDRVPWLASQTDILAEDWSCVDETDQR